MAVIKMGDGGFPPECGSTSLLADLGRPSPPHTSQSDMTLARAAVLPLAVLLAAALVYGDPVGVISIEPVSELCLGCICEAISSCNRSLGCTGDVCGIFMITWAYWADAGKPTLALDNPNTDGAYPRCVIDPVCAAETVKNYMQKFAQDCNGDGVINCYDYAAIHKLGGYGCRAPLDPFYQSKYLACEQAVIGPNIDVRAGRAGQVATFK